MATQTLNLRHPHLLQTTRAVLSNQSRKPLNPLSGTTALNSSQLNAASVPTLAVRSGQSKIPSH
jgi:hypothetical protein